LRRIPAKPSSNRIASHCLDYRVIGKQVFVYVIIDSEWDKQALLQHRLSGA